MVNKVIFLDVDGVLNACNKFYDVVWKICKKLHILKWYDSHFDEFGVKLYRVFLLWIIVKFTRADIVLSSSWRIGYLNPDRKLTPNQRELEKKLSWFGLHIHDVTEQLGHRGEEIQTYLFEHPDITNYVILDDDKYDIIETMGAEHLVITSYGGPIRGYSYEDTGMKIKDAIKAIKILNQEDKKDEYQN